MRLFSSALFLIAASVWANTGNAAVCAEGSPEERLACLTRTHCPVVVSESDKADCYRRITLDLLGMQKLDQPAVAPPAAPKAPAPVADAQPVAPSPPAAPVATTTTAEQISEQNRQTSISAAERQDNFGYEWHEAPREQIIQEINSKIVFLDTLVRGNYLIGLENGQLWLQIAKSRTRLKEGEKVRIVRGSLRSFKLFPEKSSATNVNRVVCHGEEPSSLCRLFEDWQQAQD